MGRFGIPYIIIYLLLKGFLLTPLLINQPVGKGHLCFHPFPGGYTQLAFSNAALAAFFTRRDGNLGETTTEIPRKNRRENSLDDEIPKAYWTRISALLELVTDVTGKHLEENPIFERFEGQNLWFSCQLSVRSQSISAGAIGLSTRGKALRVRVTSSLQPTEIEDEPREASDRLLVATTF